MQTSPPHAQRLFMGGFLTLLVLLPLFAACSNGSSSTGITPTPQRTYEQSECSHFSDGEASGHVQLWENWVISG
jgi:hypothetical protein